MKDKNPMEKVYFYKKSDPDTGFDIPEEKVRIKFITKIHNVVF